MAYDPQARRRRPKPAPAEAAPVDALLGDRHTPLAPKSVPDDPPPAPGVTPQPADPPSDKLLVSSGLATAIGALIALVTLRQLWRRRRPTTNED
ncbi:MAG: hypothetical protein RIB98_03955 [Acidimicrobiales bacterium]